MEDMEDMVDTADMDIPTECYFLRLLFVLSYDEAQFCFSRPQTEHDLICFFLQ